MAKPIVDGIPEKTDQRMEVIHLNLVSGVGREVAGQYGIRMVPATVLVDNRGQLLDRQSGRPDSSRLINKMSLVSD
jgi:thioredoxin-like negative regulator of GroEL